MKNTLIALVAGISCSLLFSSCSSVPTLSSSKSQHEKFTSKAEYAKSYDIYKDEKLLADTSAKASKIVVDKTSQRLQLYIGDQVAIDTPCTTGKSGKRTPSGTFKVTSKIKDKRSNIFGRCYRNGKVVYGGDRRKYSGSCSKFVGSSLPYWMRLTDDGIGLHGSSGIKRYPASNGCIRLPHSIVPTIYYRTNKHSTPVIVR